ncbi:MAG: hypothetical protein GY864_06660 [Desulfobacterales bacterium]|nr:hypothetical protein [Desulfobacterales bacterium]
MKKAVSHLLNLFIPPALVFCFVMSAGAKVELNTKEIVPLKDHPLDITISIDGATAYVLCEENILLISTQESKVVDTIPLTDIYSRIALSPDGNKLLLTNSTKKEVSIIRISTVYDIEIGQSPIIGKKDAPINIFLFFDYQ